MYKAVISHFNYNYSSNQMRLKAQNKGSLEYYALEKGLVDTKILWESDFIKALDTYLLNPLSINNQSLKNRIDEFLDHEDLYINGFSNTEHYANVLESLDNLFLETTKELSDGKYI